MCVSLFCLQRVQLVQITADGSWIIINNA